jgi:hypothetical protein
MNGRHSALWTAGTLALLVLVAGPAELRAQGVSTSVPPREEIAFVDVGVVDIETGDILPMHTVLVRDGRIEAVGPAAEVSVPSTARRIEGDGELYLMPGMIDMHVHMFDRNEMLLYLANGITSVRNLHGIPLHLAWQDSIVRGYLLGPRIYTSGPILDGDPPTRSTNQVIRTIEEANRVVAEQAELGYGFIKIYDHVPRDVYEALANAAASNGLPMVGHVPTPVGIEGLLEVGGQAGIEHGEELLPFFDDGRDTTGLGDLARRLADAGVWLTPTITVMSNAEQQFLDWSALMARPEMRYVNPGTVADWGWIEMGQSRAGREGGAEVMRRRAWFSAQISRELRAAGGHVLVGSDAPIAAIVPGFSFFVELRALVEAGLSTREVLAAATVEAARFLGLEGQTGVVREGANADLVLLASDPLADIDNTQRRVGVMSQGRWMPEEELHRRLELIAESYAEVERSSTQQEAARD